MATCAVMGVDWRTLTLWEYQCRLHGWNEAHSTDRPAADVDRLSKLLEAHRGGNC